MREHNMDHHPEHLHEHNSDHSPAKCIEIVPIFSSITYQEMLEIAAITTNKTYQKGDMIYTEGDKGERLYVIHKGKVKISRISFSGKEQVIRVLGPGEFMGELSVFNPKPMTDNAEALETSTMCIIEGGKLKELMSRTPSITMKVMEELSRRLETAETLIEDINLHSVEQRLAHVLLRLSSGKKEITLNMKKGDMASQIGMSQETLSRQLAAFQENGLIELKGQRTINIIDRDGLGEFLSI